MLNSLRRFVDNTPREHLPDGPSQPVTDVRAFTPTSIGSGAFGKWVIDADGLPAYQYDLDQYADPRAKYQNSQGLDRRDHWYAIGNDRLNVLAGNDGTIQVYIGDRGGMFLNHFDDGAGPDDWLEGFGWLPDPIKSFVWRLFADLRQRQLNGKLQKWYATHPADTNRVKLAEEIQDTMKEAGRTTPLNPDKHIHYSGGFSYLDDGTETWATAYKYRPAKSETRRVFGVGYYETENSYRGIREVRRTYSPFGNDPIVITDVYLRNTTDQPITIRHYEYWDVNQHQLKANWFETGLAAVASTDSREAVNDNFIQRVDWDANTSTLRSQMTAIVDGIPREGDASRVDYYPSDVFLIDLEGQADAVYTDKQFFFGDDGTPEQPNAIRTRAGSRLLDETSALHQPFLLVQRRVITLQPNEIKQLRYGYGAARPGESLDWVQRYRSTSSQSVTDAWKPQLAYFSTGANPVMSREMAWHSYALQQNVVYNEYFKNHVITQGSAYLYLHGFDGAPRDQALFSMPMTYLRPELAKESIRFIMALTRADNGYMSYAFSGNGILEGAGIHNKPSDLDLFLLLAATEYLAATGDYAFLEERVPYFPAGEIPSGAHGDTVLDHLRYAYDHLVNVVGIGANGLVKVGDGDWADGVVIENAAQHLFLGVSFNQSVENGESVLNSQMALYILPLFANAIEKQDAQLAGRMRAIVPKLREAVQKQFGERWYSRAILRDAVNQPVVIDKFTINLEAQSWALISGLAAEKGVEKTLIDAIQGRLDGNAPTGAPYIEHNGQISAAISQFLTWGYSRSRPDLAWQSLQKLSFANHAIYFPNIWYGIWTAPDSLNPVDDQNYPGGTWVSPVTPMTDFPAMNSNPHAMSLLSLIRLAGIEPLADGLRIAPRIPKDSFTLDLPLIKVVVDKGSISGEYRAIVDGGRTLYVEVPLSATALQVMVNGEAIATPQQFGGYVFVPLTFKKGDKVSFNVSWGEFMVNAPLGRDVEALTR